MHSADQTPDETLDAADASSRRVLIVDDSPLQRKLLNMALRKWGYVVLEAENAERALAICATQSLDLVVSDWMMPGMSGPEFCRALRSSESASYTYFILLTSKSETAEIATGLESGADDFLTKPVDNHELHARIRAGERILDMQNRLQENNRALSNALAEVERLNDALDSDLKEARQLQRSLLPEKHRSFGSFDVSLYLESSGYVGGDLVGFYPAGPNHLGIFSIDVSGHGISAALMTARLAGFLSPVAPDQNVALSKCDDGTYAPVAPEEAIHNLNKLVLEEMETEHYFTMLLGDVDLRTGLVRLGQAGHPHPLVHRANGTMVQDSPGGFPVGLLPTAKFSRFDIQLEPGDRLLLHSDGITECPAPDGEMLGEEGLERLAKPFMELRGLEFFEAFMWAFDEFAGGEKRPDDVSAVLLDYRGERA